MSSWRSIALGCCTRYSLNPLVTAYNCSVVVVGAYWLVLICKYMGLGSISQGWELSRVKPSRCLEIFEILFIEPKWTGSDS
jgi:hypothetical protein